MRVLRSRRLPLATLLVAMVLVGAGCAQFTVVKEVRGNAPDDAGPFVVDVVCDPLDEELPFPANTEDRLVFDGAGELTSEPLVVDDNSECVLTESDADGAGYSEWVDCDVALVEPVAVEVTDEQLAQIEAASRPPSSVVEESPECHVAHDGQSATLHVNDIGECELPPSGGAQGPQAEGPEQPGEMFCPALQVTATVVNYFPGPADLKIEKLVGDYNPGDLDDFAVDVYCHQGNHVVFDDAVTLAPSESEWLHLEVAPSAYGENGDDLVCEVSESETQGGTASFACVDHNGADCATTAKVVFPYELYWDAQFEPQATPNATVTVTNTFDAPPEPVTTKPAPTPAPTPAPVAVPAAVAVVAQARFTG